MILNVNLWMLQIGTWRKNQLQMANFLRLNEMVAVGIKPDVATYNVFIAVCMRAKDWTWAIELPSPKPVAKIGPKTDKSAVCHQDAKKAEGWLCRMAKAGVKADAVSYCTMIDAFAQSGELHRAEQWLEKMEASGLQVSSGTYGLLVNAVAKMGDVGRVERIFKRMEQANVEVRRCWDHFWANL